MTRRHARSLEALQRGMHELPTASDSMLAAVRERYLASSNIDFLRTEMADPCKSTPLSHLTRSERRVRPLAQTHSRSSEPSSTNATARYPTSNGCSIRSPFANSPPYAWVE
jgi:hypothetical protein